MSAPEKGDRPPECTDPNSAEKDVAYFSAAIQAWLENRMEHDRTVLQISALGLGFVATMLLTSEHPPVFLVILDCLTGIGFLSVIFMLLRIFQENANYLRECVKPDARDVKNPLLAFLDTMVTRTFVLSLLLTFISVLIRVIVTPEATRP